jgi:hypothetical protein
MSSRPRLRKLPLPDYKEAKNNSTLFGCPASPSPQGVEEFKALYLKHYGVTLNDQDALEAATRLLHLLYFGLTPLPGESPSGDALPEVQTSE